MRRAKSWRRGAVEHRKQLRWQAIEVRVETSRM
jgi:hypothetical protein